MDKTKVIIFSSIGLAVLLVGYLFFRAAHKKSSTGDRVQLASGVGGDKYTYKEMMSTNALRSDHKDYDTLSNFTVPVYGNSSPASQPIKTQDHAQSTEEARLNEALAATQQKDGDRYGQKKTAELRKIQREILQTNLSRPKPIVTHRPAVTSLTDSQYQISQPDPLSKGKVLFYDEDKDNGTSKKSKPESAILLQAVTHGDQNVIEGGTIKLRTIQEAEVNNVVIPRNTALYGLVGFENNRISVTVTMIKKDGSNIYVNLQAYDQGDGRPGLNVRGGELSNDLRDAGAQASTEATSTIDNVPLVGTVSRGVKQVFTNRRNRNQSILIGSNYKIFLK
jgi:Conjugative transposon, TraM